MNVKVFWELISLIDQDALEKYDEEEAVEPLVSELSAKSEQEIDQFHEHLSQMLYAIDGQNWIEESGESSGSGDGFLYARCYVVAKGREYYSITLSNPTSMPKSSNEWAESLLYVAGRAWAEVTGNNAEDYPRESTVSFESFSNKAQW